MKQLTALLIIILFYGCQTTSLDTNDNNFKGFNDFLGQEKANALDQVVNSFDTFLATNFPDKETQGERTLAFLQKLSITFTPDTSWIFDTKKNIKIIKKLESSGIRKEILLYEYEDYIQKYFISNLYLKKGEDSMTEALMVEEEIIEEIVLNIGLDTTGEAERRRRDKEMEEKYDSALWFNVFGQFLYGLARFTQKDSLIQGYVQDRICMGRGPFWFLIPSYMESEIDYDSPFIKRMLVADLYIELLQWDIERKGGK